MLVATGSETRLREGTWVGLARVTLAGVRCLARVDRRLCIRVGCCLARWQLLVGRQRLPWVGCLGARRGLVEPTWVRSVLQIHHCS